MQRRAIVSVCLLFVLFFGVGVRIALVTVDKDIHAVGMQQGAKTITVTEVRGTIYDRNLVPLVNQRNEYFATLLPQMNLLQRLSSVTDLQEYARLEASLEDRVPLLARLNAPAPICDGLRVYMAPKRYSNPVLASHLIGYLDAGQSSGVYGIEKAYDTLLKQYTGRITATFPTDGRGNYLSGENVRVTNTTARSIGGVILTLDSEMQAMVEGVVSEQLRKGAVVILNANSGEILTLVSCPTLNPLSIEKDLKRTDGVFINRALSLFDCGSIFKIVTAIAALEEGVSQTQCYECPGSITVDGTTFHCHYRLGHQSLAMEQAFAQSCNVYFIQLAQQIGADALLDMARRLGLTEDVVLAESIVAPAAVFPTIEDLSSSAALANLSFGQGKLLLSPVHIARMTAAIAANGTLPSVSAVAGTIDEKQRWTSSQDTRGGETVISAKTVGILDEMMKSVVREGTGQAAQSRDGGLVAGKTGTAQTGQLQDGDSVVHSWFTGYVSIDESPYVITVLVEDIGDMDTTAAELFCEISNKLR